MRRTVGWFPAKDTVAVSFKVLTVSELDRMVFEQLVRDGAARPDEDDPSRYVVTRREIAHSSVVMPKILNPLGKKGWVLQAVNKMECYIFYKDEPATPVEYKVMTPVDLDKEAVKGLEKSGALKLHHFEDRTPALEVVDPAAAKIQVVLPELLGDLARQGWRLTAISGPQLHFFARPL